MHKNKIEQTKVSHLQVLFYYPNIIGYLRFIFNIASIPYAYDSQGNSWIIFLTLYSVSMALDAFDGMVARKFDQCSRFGAALDMVSDRTSCATIYLILNQIYPKWSYAFLLCYILDFGSHFLQFCSSAMMKSDSHKGKNKKENFLVDFYYNNYTFFITLVTCSEVCSVFLVIMRKSEVFGNSTIAQAISAFLCLNLTTKMIINVF